MTDKELIRLLHGALRAIAYRDSDGTWRSGFHGDSDITGVIGVAMNEWAKWERQQHD
jgi:hypothetical protein